LEAACAPGILAERSRAGCTAGYGRGRALVSTLFYARLTPALGLPALPAERAEALVDALALGPRKLALAGGLSFLGDVLLLAACVALTSSCGIRTRGVERAAGR
jgi:hypothetical protein